MMRTPKLTPAEKKAAANWRLSHPCKGDYDFIFAPGQIGIHVYVRCNVCGEASDITEYGSWEPYA